MANTDALNAVEQNHSVVEWCLCHRWIEVISSVTLSSRMTRMFSRMESIQSSSQAAEIQPPEPRSEVYESDVV